MGCAFHNRLKMEADDAASIDFGRFLQIFLDSFGIQGVSGNVMRDA
jgi:hypothetical protein